MGEFACLPFCACSLHVELTLLRAIVGRDDFVTTWCLLRFLDLLGLAFLLLLLLLFCLLIGVDRG